MANRGRPSEFNQATADRICDEIAHGQSLRRICESDDMPGDSTVYRWLDTNAQFREQYARARDLQAEYYAAEIIEIADDATNDFIEVQRKSGKEIVFDKEAVLRSSLRVDARKWYASKVAPKKYGDKIGLDVTGELNIAGAVSRIRDRVNADNEG